ncbi:MAG: thiamine pyrophosphate-dependent enzyme [Chloroflexota bacterium]
MYGPNYDWDMGYRTKVEVEEWMAKDPVESWKKRLIKAKLTNEANLGSMVARIDEEIESAFALAKNDPVPDDAVFFEDVY